MEINIGPFDKLRCVNAKPLHETVRLTYACFNGFVFPKYDL